MDRIKNQEMIIGLSVFRNRLKDKPVKEVKQEWYEKEPRKNNVTKAKERNLKKSRERSQGFKESNVTCHRIFSVHDDSLGVCSIQKTAGLVLSLTSYLTLGKLLIPPVSHLLHL